MVIEQLTARGIMDASAVDEPPFSNLHAEGKDALFDGKENVIKEDLRTFEGGGWRTRCRSRMTQTRGSA